MKHRDQIHRDVYFDELSIALINTPEMQRLGRVYQLGFAHLVFRGGTHTRLSHVMGTASIAEEIVACLRLNYDRSLREKNLPGGVILPDRFLPKSSRREISLSDRWEALSYLVKWAALLHDIGHIPWGHTLEDEFSGIYERHDSLDSIRMEALWNQQNGKDSTIKLILMNKSLYPDALLKFGIEPQKVWQIVFLICLYKPEYQLQPNSKNTNLRNEYNIAFSELSAEGLFHQYMAEIVSDTICADYSDYLQRDTINVGLDTVKEKRLIQSYYIGAQVPEDEDEPENNRKKPIYRMCLSLSDKNGKARLSICSGVKNLVRHRFDLAEIIYYHKTKVAASAMMAKVLSLISKPDEVEPPLFRFELSEIADYAEKLINGTLEAQTLHDIHKPKSLLHPLIGDESLLFLLHERAWESVKRFVGSGNKEQVSNSLLAVSLLDAIVERRLYKVALSLDYRTMQAVYRNVTEPEDKIREILRKYRKNGALSRNQIEQKMSNKIKVPQGSFILYVPDLRSQAKGIETGALSFDSQYVVNLDKHPSVERDVNLLGESYKQIWRILILVHPDQLKDNNALSIAIDEFLFEIFGKVLDTHQDEIQRICTFPYLSKIQRKPALEYIKRMKELELNINWKSFYQAQETENFEENIERAVLYSFVDITFEETERIEIREAFRNVLNENNSLLKKLDAEYHFLNNQDIKSADRLKIFHKIIGDLRKKGPTLFS